MTVIMTTFNAETTVESAIESVLDQTYGEIELIVVDDVSTDATVTIVQKLCLSDARLTLIQSENNAGTYVAKNRGVAIASGAYVTFHDSDDWMHPERIEKHLAFMEDQSLAMSISNWFRMDATGYAIAQRHGAFTYRNPASTFFRREALQSLGFFDSVRTGADTELFNRCRLRFGKSAVLESKLCLAIGLHHESSLTQSGATAIDEYRYSAVRLEYWEAYGRWHLESETEGRQIFMPQKWDTRPFEIPQSINPF